MLKKYLLLVIMASITAVYAAPKITINTTEPVKVYLNNKLLDSDFYLNKEVKKGDLSVTIIEANGSILDKRTVNMSDTDHLIYNYDYSTKTNTMMKSIIPGLGQFSTQRYLSGGLIAATTLGCAGYIFSEYGNFTDKEDKYDTAKANSNYKEANTYQSQCEDASTNMKMGFAALGAVYVFNLIDAYLFTNEKRLTIEKENSDFKITPLISSQSNKTAFGFAINF